MASYVLRLLEDRLDAGGCATCSTTVFALQNSMVDPGSVKDYFFAAQTKY